MSNLVGDKNVAQLEQHANPKAAQGSMGAYEKPQLICYGDVRDITLGPSPGFLSFYSNRIRNQ